MKGDFSFANRFKDNREKVFLHRTEDEKWIFYDNPKKKKYYVKPGQSLPSTSTSTPRPNIQSSKIMHCIWWYQQGLVYELLKPDFITGDRYRLQLIRFSRALREKRLEYGQRRDKIILLYDNARPIWNRSNGMFYRTRRILWNYCFF